MAGPEGELPGWGQGGGGGETARGRRKRLSLPGQELPAQGRGTGPTWVGGAAA